MTCLYLILELVCIFVFALPVSAQLYLNEILPDPSTSEPATEWLELYNASSSALTLTNYSIQDANQNTFTLPEATISAHGYLVFYGADGIPSLNNSGDTISFYNPDHQLLDTYTYTSSSEDMSWARIPDGGEFSSQPQTPTPNQPNPTPSPTPSPTPTPPPTSSPSPSPTSLPTPSPTPTPSPSPSLIPTPSSRILGLQTSYPEVNLAFQTATSATNSFELNASRSASPEATVSSVNAQPVSRFPSLLFVIGGLLFLLLASAYFFFLA